MTSWKIEPCTLADAPALAPNNMTAFWATDANWKLGWTLQDITLDFLIKNFHDRIPNNLLKDRETLRHYKAVDPETGALMGYARWMLPASCANSPHWADGQIADVSEEEREAIRARNEATWWKPMHMEGLDDCGPEKKRILEKGEYISLEYLAVHPDNTGKGVASALVKHGVELGKKTGVDLFILAFQAAFNVYKRQGFKVIHSAYQDDTKYGGVGYWVNLLTYEVNKPKDEEKKRKEADVETTTEG